MRRILAFVAAFNFFGCFTTEAPIDPNTVLIGKYNHEFYEKCWGAEGLVEGCRKYIVNVWFNPNGMYKFEQYGSILKGELFPLIPEGPYKNGTPKLLCVRYSTYRQIGNTVHFDTIVEYSYNNNRRNCWDDNSGSCSKKRDSLFLEDKLFDDEFKVIYDKGTAHFEKIDSNHFEILTFPGRAVFSK
jgi:hypothetical protein